MHKFIVSLTTEDIALIKEANLECFVVNTAESQNEQLVLEAQKHSKIILITGESACELCQKYDADGVLIDLSKSEHCVKEVNWARKQIGNKVLGVISRNRRHESMLISECEPEFVAFKAWQQGLEQTKELVAWYNEMFLLQSAVVLEEEISNPQSFECDILILSASEYKNLKKETSAI